MSTLRNFLDRVRRGDLDGFRHLRLPNGHVSVAAGTPTEAPSTAIAPGVHYFDVTVNSMRLDYARQWNKSFDPMVLAVTEFSYAGEDRTMPFVVGPSLVQGAQHGVPPGMVFSNTVVASTHPYNGGLAVTVILYRMERDDFVKRVLGVIEKTCAAVDLSTTLSTYVKIGEAVLDGVETLLGYQQMQPLLGYRIEFEDKLQPGTFVVTPAKLAESQLWLMDGELRQGADSASATAVQATSYVTYTVGMAEPTDLETLPWFAPLWKRIVQWANIPTDEAKDVAKDYLAALYEEIATSPDVARDSADTLYSQWEARARNIHQVARNRASWGPSDPHEDTVRARALAIRGAS
jgi:hypothetical protein